MSIIREHIVSRFLCLAMAFHIFNLSLDAPDFESDFITDDVKHNDMESIVEMILEHVLEFDNAIAEQAEHDIDHKGSMIVKMKIDFSSPCSDFIFNSIYNFASQARSDYADNVLDQFDPEITSPPPKV